VLFEAASGERLFLADVADDMFVSEASKMQLANWKFLEDDRCERILPVSGVPREARRVAAEDCRALIQWLLQGDPRDRPTMKQVLAHRFLNAGSPQPCSAQRPCRPTQQPGPCGAILDERCKVARKYSCFISHYQAEASGEVGNLWSHLKLLGIQAWRDVNQRDIVLETMLQGVRDSDCVVVLLTNTTLSRWYCLQEISLALELDKPIYVIQETDSRFWPWDHRRSALDLLRWVQQSFPREATVEMVKHNRVIFKPLRPREHNADAAALEFSNKIDAALALSIKIGGWVRDENPSYSWYKQTEHKEFKGISSVSTPSGTTPRTWRGCSRIVAGTLSTRLCSGPLVKRAEHDRLPGFLAAGSCERRGRGAASSDAFLCAQRGKDIVRELM
jgi:serine/threonine protein kinase